MLKILVHILHFFLVMLSIPFGVVGFILGFAIQGISDGMDMHHFFYRKITKAVKKDEDYLR